MESGCNLLYIVCLMEFLSDIIVMFLINERFDDIIEFDDGGLILLYYVVFKVWYNELEEGREWLEYSGVICYLMCNM